MPTHQEIDQRSLAMHRLVADEVLADVQLLDHAKATLRRWHQSASPRTVGYLNALQGLLDRVQKRALLSPQKTLSVLLLCGSRHHCLACYPTRSDLLF
jgi:hypothetical protein